MTEHEHSFGPVELARFTGNPHRKCACGMVSLDLDEGDAPELVCRRCDLPIGHVDGNWHHVNSEGARFYTEPHAARHPDGLMP